MRILADKVIADAEQAFAAYGAVELFDGRELTKDNLQNADVLLVRSVTRVDQQLLADTAIKFVGTATAGVDHIDQTLLANLGIPFASAPGCNANAVSEFIATSTLKFCAEKRLQPTEMSAGIIGHGEVGSRVAVKLGALGFRCFINDPLKAETDSAIQYCDLSTALRADIITIHTPLTSTGKFPTVNMLGVPEIDAMSSCQLFINAARGGIVNEGALLAKSQADEKFCYQLDCWTDEPQVNIDVLAGAYLTSPHVAGHSIEARLNATHMLVRSLSRSSGIANDWSRQLPAPDENAAARRTKYEAWLEHTFDDVGQAAALAALTEYCCPVSQIDEATRELAREPPSRRAALFDQLRRQFASRREFSFYKLPIAVCAELSQNTAHQLGFQS